MSNEQNGANGQGTSANLPSTIDNYIDQAEARDIREAFQKKLIPKSMIGKKRNFQDWYDEYLRYASTSASPPLFHKWTALTALASALQRKVWWDFEFELTYPNMFVFLIGESGAKKSTALNVAKPLMIDAGITRTPTRLTPEAFFHRMADQATVYYNKDDNEELLLKQTATTVLASELSVFFAGDIDAFVQSLTDIFDCRMDGDPWHYLTRHQGEASLENNWLTMLACTTPDYILKSLPRHARNEGFLGRVVLVYGKLVRIKTGLPIGLALKAGMINDERYHKFDKQTWDAYRADRRIRLTDDLKQIKKLYGAFDADGETLMAFEDWFQKNEDDIADDNLLIKRKDFGGYLTRRSTYLRKLMMLFCVSRGNDLMINYDDFVRARDLLLETEKYMFHVFEGDVAEIPFKEALMQILKYFWVCTRRKIPITNQQLFNDFLLQIDLDECERAIDQLQKAKFITIVNVDLSDGSKTYELTDHGAQYAASIFGVNN